MWRHQRRDHSIRDMLFPTGGPLELNLYLHQSSTQSAPKYVGKWIKQWTNEWTNNQQTQRIAIPPGSNNNNCMLYIIQYSRVGTDISKYMD